MYRFTIRELVLVTIIVAVAVAWFVDHRGLASWQVARTAKAAAEYEAARAAVVEFQQKLQKSGIRLSNSADTTVPLFDGLGNYEWKVATESPDAQRYINQGLSFLFSFNHDEAIRSFVQAAELDPKCAMAWGGAALANGPHINNPVMTPERSTAAWEALEKARELAVTSDNRTELALIYALSKRYANPPPADRTPLDKAYASAMRQVWKANPNDADVGALFAEAMMDLRPWDLWTADGQPQAGTDEIVATLETVLAKSPHHPLAMHLYVHALEASPAPEKALGPTDPLRTLQPGLGHLVHMPSHLDVRLGRWHEAIEANYWAIAADRRYRQQSPEQEFYHVYMAHNHHMLAYAAMMTGQSRLAIATINEMVEGIPTFPPQEIGEAADGFAAMPLEVLIRFGRWDETLNAPEPPEYLPLARTLRHVSRGIAFAAKKDVLQARQEHREFLKEKLAVSATARFGNNRASDLLAIAELLLDGEILLREGKTDEGTAQLRAAVAREDKLRYSEPPDWIHPVRHVLGAALLAAGKADEAEQVYREDLANQPNNGWSLYGLARSLRFQNKDEEAQKIELRFEDVWRDADITISSSCLCQPGK